MKIKRFKAPDMRQAIKMVREEHGADAVILSNRKVGDGIEIISAIDYDENYIESMLEQSGSEQSPLRSQPMPEAQSHAQPSHSATAPERERFAQETMPQETALDDMPAGKNKGLPGVRQQQGVQAQPGMNPAYAADAFAAQAHPGQANQAALNRQQVPAGYSAAPSLPAAGHPEGAQDYAVQQDLPQRHGAYNEPSTSGLNRGMPVDAGSANMPPPSPAAVAVPPQAAAELNEVDDFSFAPPPAPGTAGEAQQVSAQAGYSQHDNAARAATANRSAAVSRAAMTNPMLAAAYSQIQHGTPAESMPGRRTTDLDQEDRVSITSTQAKVQARGGVDRDGTEADTEAPTFEDSDMGTRRHDYRSSDREEVQGQSSHYESQETAQYATERKSSQVEASRHDVRRAQQVEPAAAQKEPESPAYRPERDLEMLAMQRELDTLKSLLNSQISQPSHMGIPHVHPAHTGIYARLQELGIRTDLANEVLAQLPLSSEVNEGWRKALAVLAHKLTIAEEDIIETGGIVALLGPTGVGKTTTIAKLAARYALKHGRDKVALISMDNYRVAAHEQICSYGKMIGAPVYMPSTLAEFNTTLSDLYDKPLVLIDTPGVSQRDKRIKEQHEIIQNTSYELQSYLTISANTQVQALNQIAKAYSSVDLSGCVITKIDEAASMGGMLSVLVKWALPVAYISEGQRVPDDLMRARPYSLVSKAVTMMQQTELLSSSGAAINSREDSYNAHAG